MAKEYALFFQRTWVWSPVLVLGSWQLLVSPAPRDLTPLVSMIGSMHTHTWTHETCMHTCTHMGGWGHTHTRTRTDTNRLPIVAQLSQFYWVSFQHSCPLCVPDVPAGGRDAVSEAMVCGPRVKGSPSTAWGSSPDFQVPQNTVWKPLVWITHLKTFTTFRSLKKYLVIAKVSKT